MTKITFYKKEKYFTGFEIVGHTGKEARGKDLLCCQLSTVAHLAVVGIQEVGGYQPFVEISDGYLKIKVDEKKAKNDKVKFLFDTCYESFRSIIIGEEKYAKLEVKNDF